MTRLSNARDGVPAVCARTGRPMTFISCARLADLVRISLGIWVTLLSAVGCASATRVPGQNETRKVHTSVAPRFPGPVSVKLGERCRGTDGQGSCTDGLLCCMTFHGQCGGVTRPEALPSDPCVTSAVCAKVERCWGAPP